MYVHCTYQSWIYVCTCTIHMHIIRHLGRGGSCVGGWTALAWRWHRTYHTLHVLWIIMCIYIYWATGLDAKAGGVGGDAVREVPRKNEARFPFLGSLGHHKKRRRNPPILSFLPTYRNTCCFIYPVSCNMCIVMGMWVCLYLCIYVCS